MVSSLKLSFAIIFLHSFNYLLAETESSCKSIYVTIQNFGGNSVDINNWNGVYSIDTTKTSFNASIWRIPNSNKWLKYIETHWVLSGENNQLLIYESTTLFPPTNQSTTWVHESYSDPPQLRLDCSSSLSPTTSPTPSPTTHPTYSPTISDCNILIVSDSSGNNNINATYFTNWKYYRFANDFKNRPIWRYLNGNIESYVQFLNANGWIVFLNNAIAITTYAGDKLFGNFPPLNRAILFNITTNYGLMRIFTFRCIATDIPTSSPSISPSIPPTFAPTVPPSISPTTNPNSAPIPSPTFSPTDMPTVAPSIDCDVLKINIERNLIINNNPGCNINFEEVFDSYWLKQISRSNRPSWALDCNDQHEEYTEACEDGYSGSVFFISNQWEIQIHSKKDDCFERFIVDNTGSFSMPTDKQWIDESTFNSYSFTIQCTDRLAPEVTGDTFITKNKVYIYDEIWFWIAFILILLICFALCFAAYYYNKKRNEIVVYKPKPVKSMSHMHPSRQALELQNTPHQAYIDDDIAPAQPINDITNDQYDDILNEEHEVKDNIAYDGAPKATGSTVNPNLKPNVNNDTGTNVAKVGGELKENESGSDDDIYNELYNEPDNNKDKALDIIAGNRRVTGYNTNTDDIIIRDEDVEEIFNV